MKKVVVLILFLAFTSCKNNDLTFQINGNVRKVNYIYKEATEKFGKIIEGKIINDSLISLNFNEKGQLIDSLWNKSEYKQSENLWHKDMFQKTKTYKKDLLIKETIFKNKILNNFKTYSYDNDKKINEITLYSRNKEILNKRIYKYLEKLCYVKIYNSDGTLTETEKITYDNSNNIIEILNSKGKTTFKYFDGILTEKKHERKITTEHKEDFNSSEHTDKTTYTKISIYDKNGEISSYNKIMYNVTLTGGGISFQNGGSSNILKYSYSKYDEIKNWTLQVVRYDTQISHIIQREITYQK